MESGGLIQRRWVLGVEGGSSRGVGQPRPLLPSPPTRWPCICGSEPAAGYCLPEPQFPVLVDTAGGAGEGRGTLGTGTASGPTARAQPLFLSCPMADRVWGPRVSLGLEVGGKAGVRDEPQGRGPAFRGDGTGSVPTLAPGPAARESLGPGHGSRAPMWCSSSGLVSEHNRAGVSVPTVPLAA